MMKKPTKKGVLILLSIGMLVSGGMYKYTADSLQQVIWADYRSYNDYTQENKTSDLVQLDPYYEEMLQSLEAYAREQENNTTEYSTFLDIYGGAYTTTIRIEPNKMIEETVVDELIRRAYEGIGLTYDKEILLKQVREDGKYSRIEVDAHSLAQVEARIYGEKSSEVRLTDIDSFTIEIPNTVIKPQYFKALDEHIAGEGYFPVEIVQAGGNELISYTDMPSHIKESYILNGEEISDTGLIIDIEVKDEQILRVSGKLTYYSQKDQAPPLQNYQLAMLNRILSQFGVSVTEQEMINQLVQEEVAGHTGNKVQQVGNYQYESREGMTFYDDDISYLMKFDITLDK